MSQVPCLPQSHYFHRKRIKGNIRLPAINTHLIKYDNTVWQYDAINTTGGIKNLPVVFSNKILVLFNRSIRIPRAHARIHKVFYPCNRCHLATLLENQRVTCGNEVTRVTTNGNFALNIHSTQLLCLPNYCMRVAKPRASRVEGAASVGRSPGLQGSKVRASCPLGIIPKTLGDISFTP